MNMTAENAVWYSILVCLSGTVACLAIPRNKARAGGIALATVALASGLVLLGCLQVLWAGPGRPWSIFALPSYGFSLRLHVDGLSAVFLGLIAVVAVPATLFSVRYLEHYPDGSPRRYYPAYLIFMAAMYGIVCTTDTMYFFFIFWQAMTFAAYALIQFEKNKPENRWAAIKYLVMMQIACFATLLGAALVAPDHAVLVNQETLLPYDFDAIRHSLPALMETKPNAVHLAFFCFLVGFGIKMGIWPFGRVWLPDAHPAAPSPVSALLSGVMIKTGVYGVMRYFLWLVPLEGQAGYPARTWGWILAGLGVASLLIGTLQALSQEQSKRLLAFSSIGQVGYILFGIGMTLILLVSPDPGSAGLAAAAFFGALFHTVNHGLFKGLLFLSAGSVLYATGTQRLSQLGGLAKAMPLTAVCAMAGSMAIVGVPFWNGFVSKWTLFQAGIRGAEFAPLLMLGTAVAIFTSALTLAALVKFFGGMFLGRKPDWMDRSRLEAREAPSAMVWPQIILATACLGLGLFPHWAHGLLQQALAASQSGLAVLLVIVPAEPGGAWTGLAGFEGASRFAPLVLLSVGALVWLGVVMLSKAGKSVRTPAVPWLCGYALPQEENRFKARQWYREFVRLFHWLALAPPAEPESPSRRIGADPPVSFPPRKTDHSPHPTTQP